MNNKIEIKFTELCYSDRLLICDILNKENTQFHNFIKECWSNYYLSQKITSFNNEESYFIKKCDLTSINKNIYYKILETDLFEKFNLNKNKNKI